MHRMSTGPKTYFVQEDGVKYNFLNEPFKIDIKKVLDSEDADHRDSMTLFFQVILSSE